MNHVVLIGRLGRDPEVRFTQQGRAVARLSLATEERYTKDGQQEKRTDWHSLVVWGKLAEVVGEHLSKGREVAVEGQLRTRSYDKDGTTVYVTEVICHRVHFLGSGGERRSGGAGGGGRQDKPGGGTQPDDDDIPF